MAVYTTIDNPELYFQVKTYTGNGSTNALTLDGDEDMQPDWVWIKDRERSGYNHNSYDSVRGATKNIWTNLTNTESTYTDSLTAFNSDGFTLGADTGNGEVNINTETYVAWCWKESATAGFDIVSFTGNETSRTISHSLSAVPHFMIMKSRANSVGWGVYHHKNTSAPETDYLYLDTTAATGDSANFWNDTAPTSSVFSLGASGISNATGTMIGYLWSEVQGFSKFGSYTGNGGNIFIYTGFRPAFLMCKQTSGTANWQIYNNKVSSFNQGSGEYTLRADADTAEGSAGTYEVDLLSNGFRPVGSSSSFNSSGASYIYMAFAEAPFVNSNGVPCNAR